MKVVKKIKELAESMQLFNIAMTYNVVKAMISKKEAKKQAEFTELDEKIVKDRLRQIGYLE